MCHQSWLPTWAIVLGISTEFVIMCLLWCVPLAITVYNKSHPLWCVLCIYYIIVLHLFTWSPLLYIFLFNVDDLVCVPFMSLYLWCFAHYKNWVSLFTNWKCADAVFQISVVHNHVICWDNCLNQVPCERIGTVLFLSGSP